MFLHKCKVDGSYEEKQCDAAIGDCWCDDATTGKMIQGTRTGTGQVQVTCVDY